MLKKFFDNNQCRYCGRYESKNQADGRDWWFGADEDCDKVCDQCISKMERIVERENERNRKGAEAVNKIYTSAKRSAAAKKRWRNERKKAQTK